MHISPMTEFRKTLCAPSDKSETIRAFILGAIAQGETVARDPLISSDTLSALDCIKRLGAEVEQRDSLIVIRSKPIRGEFSLDAGNSATALRLLSGVLSGISGVKATITGDESLCRRDMSALLEPLELMGAKITTRDRKPPLNITGEKLQSIKYEMPSASAQVKSAILLAAISSGIGVKVVEPIATRRCTERLISVMGGEIQCYENTIYLKPSRLKGCEIQIGGDLSSAAYPAIAAFVTRGRAEIKNLSYSEERSGFLRVLSRMGAEIRINDSGKDSFGELKDITVSGEPTKPFIVEACEVPSLIDEIPVLAIAGCFVKGKSVIKGVGALKNKESDRIATTLEMINSLGGHAYSDHGDEITIEGNGGLKGGKVRSYGDHRIAMSAIVGLLASQEGGETDADCISVSYPEFIKDLL